MSEENPKFLMHSVHKEVWPWSEGLAKNKKMIPCDADGHPLEQDRIKDPYLQTDQGSTPADRTAAVETKPVTDSLDGMDKEALIEFAELNDVSVDKRSSPEKLRAVLREALK